MRCDARLRAGSFAAFHRYVIYPRRIAVSGGVAAVQGHTTGSHLDLPDEEEMQLSLIWPVTVADGAVQSSPRRDGAGTMTGTDR